MNLKGRAHKFGANVDTDVIIPARYLTTTDAGELGQHLMEGLAEGFGKKVSPGDMLVGTTNFGCGSSREHAPLAIKGAGISCVIARSFARIFFRNAINIGLPLLECPQADEIEEGDLLEVDLASGGIKDLTKGKLHEAAAYPPFMLEIVRAGGLVEYTRRKLSAK